MRKSRLRYVVWQVLASRVQLWADFLFRQAGEPDGPTKSEDLTTVPHEEAASESRDAPAHWLARVGGREFTTQRVPSEQAVTPGFTGRPVSSSPPPMLRATGQVEGEPMHAPPAVSALTSAEWGVEAEGAAQELVAAAPRAGLERTLPEVLPERRGPEQHSRSEFREELAPPLRGMLTAAGNPKPAASNARASGPLEAGHPQNDLFYAEKRQQLAPPEHIFPIAEERQGLFRSSEWQVPAERINEEKLAAALRWPVLPTEMTTSSRDWGDWQRSQARQQRLDQEQRGESWNA